MPERIEYVSGQTLGPYGIIFIKDVKNYNYKGKSIRQAEFECPHCKEHKHFIARIGNIKNGHTKSCGCLALKASKETIIKYNKEHNNTPWNKIFYKSGDILGNYGVIYLREDEKEWRSSLGTKQRKAWFICPYCKKEFCAFLDNVRRGLTRSCGCYHQSYGEKKIKEILINLNIIFEEQKSFPDCYSTKNWPLKFDFYLPNYNCCIEYDGEQHFKEFSFFESSLEEVQQRDNIKNLFCKEKGIKIIRIPYTKYKNIDEKLILKLLGDL